MCCAKGIFCLYNNVLHPCNTAWIEYDLRAPAFRDLIIYYLKHVIDRMDIPLLGVVPYSDEVMEFEFNGRPLVELGDDSQLYQSVATMIKEIL